MRGLEFKGLSAVEGPIIIMRREENVGLGEIVAIRNKAGDRKTGKILEVAEDYVAVQVFGQTTGISVDDTSVEFLGNPMELLVSEDMLGRIYDGLGRPIDGYAQPFSLEFTRRERRTDQSLRPGLSAGLHSDRDILDRRHEHPDPRAKAPDLFRERAAA